MKTTTRPTFRERCQAECTANVIFLFQWRLTKKSQHWLVERVFLSREEAEAWGKAHEYRWPGGWRVYGTCAEGELVELLRGT